MKYVSILIFLTFSCSKEKEPLHIDYQIPAGKDVKQARFLNHTIYLDLVTEDKDTLTFYTDTGGGKLLYPETAEKLDIPIDSMQENENLYEAVDLAPSFKKNNIPSPIGKQFIYRKAHSSEYYNAGILGGSWFDGKIWKFNYIDKKLFTVDSIEWNKLPEKQIVALGFMKGDGGEHPTHFPRIPIIIEDDTIQTLLDTGAHMLLSNDATEFFDGEENVASSFIIASIFNKWISKHPDWKVIQKGDSLVNEDLIQVPEVTIGGHTVGPVWFAKRADKNFTEWMSQWMDQKIQGAIGGSCFRYFDTIILDYKDEKAYFNIAPTDTKG